MKTAVIGDDWNRGKPLPQICLERLQPRHSGRPGTIDRRLEAAGDDLATVLRSNPVRRAIVDTLAPCQCSSRIMTISPSRIT